MLKSLIVIPAYNEEGTVAGVVKSCLDYCDVLVVNDGSIDETLTASKDAGALIATSEVNQGYEFCLNVGYAHARKLGYDVMITMDADGQLPSKSIPRFLNAIEDGAGVVVGQRNNVDRICEKILSYFSSRLTPMMDPYCGMKAYDLRALKLKKFSRYNSIGTSLALEYIEQKLTCKNIDIEISERKGSSKFGGKLKSELKLFCSMIIGSRRITAFWIKRNTIRNEKF
jgi:glycosyltransferase involved in cell wall biosynthesis